MVEVKNSPVPIPNDSREVIPIFDVQVVSEKENGDDSEGVIVMINQWQYIIIMLN